ncbi:hypothetical protein CHARACLAT_002759 [Characodon lateralis]|uniref:Uncharacterized protein n=1 Tax=Characodon lateralis TaxID=208331 RepID=A0ABU7DF06_9TELE|nr:hypothetical protein [Characodon lateralis]
MWSSYEAVPYLRYHVLTRFSLCNAPGGTTQAAAVRFRFIPKIQSPIRCSPTGGSSSQNTLGAGLELLCAEHCSWIQPVRAGPSRPVAHLSSTSSSGGQHLSSCQTVLLHLRVLGTCASPKVNPMKPKAQNHSHTLL